MNSGLIMMRPLQHSIYKGVGGKHGALQFNIQAPHYYNQEQKTRDFTGTQALLEGKLRDGWRQREGAVFLEITSTKDKNVYDWENKIILALSSTDIGKVLFTLLTGEESRIIHDPGAQTANAGAVNKTLAIVSPKGTKAGVIFSASQLSGGQTKTHKVPLTGDEVIVLRTLLQAALPRMLGW